MNKPFNQAGIVILAIIVYFCYNHYNLKFKPIFDIPPIQSDIEEGRCKFIPDLIGCEDIKISEDSSFGILACGKDFEYKKIWANCEHYDVDSSKNKQVTLDKFYHYDLDKDEYEEIRISNYPVGYSLDLHGIDLKSTSDKMGRYLLFAVNHLRNSTETIEKFSYNPQSRQLEWLGNQHSHKEGDLICANSISIIDRDNFLVSNHAGFKNYWLSKAQLVGLFEGGPLTHFTHNSSKVIYNKINKSNGITFSKDRKLLFVAQSGAKSIEVFKVKNEIQQEFTHVHTIKIPILPDNLNLDHNTGDLYVAGFVNYFEVLGYLFSAPNFKNAKCSFRVNRIQIKEDSKSEIGYSFEVNTALEHNGDVLSMATVAAPSSAKNKLLISSIYGNGILSCKMN